MREWGFHRSRRAYASAGESARLIALVAALLCAWLLSLEALRGGVI